jgi:hypothetical protein
MAQDIMAERPGRSKSRSRWSDEKIIGLSPDRHRPAQAPVPPPIGTALNIPKSRPCEAHFQTGAERHTEIEDCRPTRRSREPT